MLAGYLLVSRLSLLGGSCDCTIVSYCFGAIWHVSTTPICTPHPSRLKAVVAAVRVLFACSLVIVAFRELSDKIEVLLIPLKVETDIEYRYMNYTSGVKSAARGPNAARDVMNCGPPEPASTKTSPGVTLRLNLSPELIYF